MPAEHFPTTQWTLIARLRSGDGAESRRALDELCAQYHYPLYCYTRRRGLNHHDAEDALQDFMAKLLRLESLKSADMEKGKLRTFLATAMQRFLINRNRDGRRRVKAVSLEDAAGEEVRFQHESFSDAMTPEKVMEHTWAATVLGLALDDLTAVEEKAGRAAQLEILKPFISPDAETVSYQAAAAQLKLSEPATRQIVKRLRDKFRAHLRKRVAETLSHPDAEQIDEEMRFLRASMM